MLAKANLAVLLLTRSAAQSARFAKEASAHLTGVSVIVSPVIEIEHRALFVRPEEYAGLVFTSENGVDAFAAACDARAHPVWCVGTRTAAAALSAGFTKVISAAQDGGDAEGLLALLNRTRPTPPLLHLRGAHARGDLAPRLTALGLPCDAAILYDQRACLLSIQARDALNGAAPVLIPLFSPRSAALCAESAAQAHAPLYPVAISAAAAQAWLALRPEVPIVAQRPDSAAMLDTLSGTFEAIAGSEADGVKSN
jgi:uroporphyrinogen-III synthase